MNILPARIHFCELTTRFHFAISLFGSTVPRKMGLNWFIPALAKSRVGSSCGTTLEECTCNILTIYRTTMR